MLELYPLQQTQSTSDINKHNTQNKIQQSQNTKAEYWRKQIHRDNCSYD